ncbi:response regulator [Gilvimarinus xylanilyticus]|uniref:histidine kinase n=1 Tax=Gilvimarinus xylanilyticus TaxID=2944139 RepID=A0A9X2KUB8_9GAMM|nr:response regulator [Gilvimarinus xylanilyticus]MCP8900087.1 response regulator [Gilvimarinus xylanilyticus]
MYGVNLLIVDDDEDDYLLARDLLEEISRGPYQIDWASSYDAGRSMLAENRHDLCLMDYKLGAQDGIELLREAQQIGFTGPIILLTGMHQGEVDMQALQAGAVDYLVKDNLGAEQLARSIRYALARREMEHERVERLKAEAENRSKSEFLAHLSHELRTPLSAILGFTELLINTNKDDDSLGHLRVVHRNGKHLLGLLNDILDLSKIEAGKLELEIQPVYLSSFLTDVYFLMHGAAIDKSLQLKMDVPEPLSHQIYTDPTRLRQVLLNLLGNAIKFTDFGEITLQVRPQDVDGRECLAFAVIDSGVGISEEALKTIFEPFVQDNGTYKETKAGTGLGLAISRQLVQRLGGDIQVQSTPGKGSRFEFTVDVGDISQMERRVFSLEFEAERSPSTDLAPLRGKVLVVDDLRDIRLLIGHFVQQAGLDVAYARNGEEALRLVALEKEKNAPFDIILMDIHMPVMGGHEAAQKLRQTGLEQPLIALTAAHMKGDMDRCLESGFTAYLSKPVDQHQLYTTLAHYLPAAEADDDAQAMGASVLLIEDDPDALKATSSLLELLGWRVAQALNGQEAMSQLQSLRPEVVLMDLNLPDTTGYELAGRIKNVAPDSRVIVLSGEAVAQDRAEASGIDGSFLKPVSLQDLKSI